MGTTASVHANSVCTAVKMVKITVPENIARNGTSLLKDNANVNNTCCGKKNAAIWKGPEGANRARRLAQVSLRTYEIRIHKTTSLMTEYLKA